MSIKEDLVHTLLRPEVIGLTAYKVADSTGLIKLDAMENPYSWPATMVTEWLEKLRHCRPNRYPDPAASKLKTIIRESINIPSSAELILGNGSDELIQILMMAIAGENSTVLTPEPTFIMYQQIALCLGIQFHAVPLKKIDFSLNMGAMRESIERHQPKIIFLSYPNNPTGNLFSESDILEIVRISPGLVVLDEAYAPFAGVTFMQHLETFDNLLVMRTLSKLGLAGLRLGFLAGSRRWIEQLDKLRLPYNINVLTQISAEFALSHYATFEAQTQQICKDRDFLFKQLEAINGLKVFPSSANFILFRLEQETADHVFNTLKSSSILIKKMSGMDEPLSKYLRVTVGTPEENSSFLNEIKRTL